jgi:YidC/Oxa1 family membrane protein insertase
MNEELMALYRKAGIRPGDQLAGCLPTLIQIPIFFALFRLLPAAIEIRQEPWVLWIRDLSQPDPYWVTPLVMGVVMFVSTRMSMAQQPQQMQGFQRNMMFMMPVMFTFFCFKAPSGLVVYWLFSNLFQLGQQALLYRILPSAKAPGAAPEERPKRREKERKRPAEEGAGAGAEEEARAGAGPATS